jgi:cysteine desulfurase
VKIGNSIYLDYQASTPVDPIVSEAMAAYQETVFANPHSTGHRLGKQAAEAVEQARTDIEAYLNANPEEVIFTSGATESNNQAIASVIFSNNTERKRILVSAIEHKCIKNAAYYYGTSRGYVVEEIPVLPSGQVDLDAYKRMLNDDVLLVCIMAVNNEIGSIQDIKTLAELAHQKGALFHCDAAQAPEAIDIDVKEWNVDTLSLSAHKVYGPKGVGILYMKNRLQAMLPPFIHGGGQQFGMRSGTVATGLCVGLSTALKLTKSLSSESRTKLSNLKQHLIDCLNAAGIAFSINGSLSNSHPGNLNVRFKGVNATELLEKIGEQVCVSTGSACNSEMVLASHVLLGIGLSKEEALSSLRFSFGRFTDTNQIEEAVAVIKQALSD